MDTQRAQIGVIKTFLVVEAMIYALIVMQDLLQVLQPLALVKYTGILICFVVALYLCAQGGQPLIGLAMGFTLAADTFLVLLNEHIVLGLVCFCAVQMVYCIYVGQFGLHGCWLTTRFLWMAAVMGALLAIRALTVVSFIVSFYLVNFVINLAHSVVSKQVPKLFCLGMLLFLCCDICVGLSNLTDLAPAAAIQLTRAGIWMFYLPGQVLIVLSARQKMTRRYRYARK